MLILSISLFSSEFLKVRVSESVSSTIAIGAGIPQGTVSGPKNGPNDFRLG